MAKRRQSLPRRIRQFMLANLLFWLGLLTLLANAHEMGIAILDITETAPGQGHLVFKRSKASDGRLAALDFTLQPNCTIKPLVTDNGHPNEVIQSAVFSCAENQALSQISANGFVRLAPELIIKIQRDGLAETAVLTPEQPYFKVGMPAQEAMLAHYFWLGAEHMLGGLDHLLFVTALFLLWATRGSNWKALLSLITCFTVGHSLTLALSTMQWFNLPVRAIEAWIALSVLYLAVKVMFAKAGDQFSVTDYAVVTCFGLLHGSGFSAAMLSRGFPDSQLLSTLFAFNVGIEVAQLIAVSGLLMVNKILRAQLMPSTVTLSHQSLLMVIGGMALAWTTERVLIYV